MYFKMRTVNRYEHRSRSLSLILVLILFFASAPVPTTSLLADGPSDNSSETVRRIPPVGIAISESIRQELRAEAKMLEANLSEARLRWSRNPQQLRHWADIAIFSKSVDWALRYEEIFKTNEVDYARLQLKTATDRLQALDKGQAPWTDVPGPTVGGYVSRIDGSLQPFGLVIPHGWRPNSGRQWRLDFWFHGRGETLSELAFIADRMKNIGEFSPPDTFVLHLYGRYCNGSRFAGETDFWEAFEEVRRRYPIDENRLIIRGFSLGGASAWHFAVHHAARWAAAAPGAGFSETAEFLRVFQQEQLHPTVWEQKLWRLHDATANAVNVSMVPLIAYSGEEDRQIQAADAMRAALLAEGMELTHLIGPKTGHKYEASAKAELNRRLDALASVGRTRVPREVRMVTHSLRYPQMAWVTIDALTEHWEPGRVTAQLPDGDRLLRVEADGVEALTLEFGPGEAPFPVHQPVQVAFAGTDSPVILESTRPGTDRSWKASFHRKNGVWRTGPNLTTGLRKRHGLQGPIDDAFMDSFMMVLPTGAPLNTAAGNWVTSESARAIEHWRRHYRGDARQKSDKDVSDADIRDHNLVLWGDPSSNQLLAKLASSLPIRWEKDRIVVGRQSFATDTHVPILVFPNPLNPTRYVVLNSGFTFRDYDYLNNARQTPKLPDWAIIDLRQAPNARTPGGISAAGFFGERWELR
jgi:pimeloyl-ACP methyl ester carboxylesterase